MKSAWKKSFEKENSRLSSIPIPSSLREKSAILDVGGNFKEIPNDFVWVFAGGEPPTAFLKKIGVKVGARDMTTEGSSEAKQKRSGPHLT